MHDGHRERLRKRYMENGLDGFAAHEVLELLLTFSIPRQNTNDIGHRLIGRFGTLEGVFQAEIPELMRVEGVGQRSALLLHLCGNLFRRVQLEQAAHGTKNTLLNAEDAARYAIELTRGERYECTYVISLDKNRGILHADRVAVGTLAETPLYPRTVVETALMQRAYSVMLVHNHPSGDPTPSGADRQVTESVDAALRSIGIQLFDHLVVGGHLVYSFSRGIILRFAGETMSALLPEEVPALLKRLTTRPPKTATLAAEEEV